MYYKYKIIFFCNYNDCYSTINCIDEPEVSNSNIEHFMEQSIVIVPIEKLGNYTFSLSYKRIFNM